MHELEESPDINKLSKTESQTFEDAKRELQSAKEELKFVLEIIKQKIKEDEGSSDD